MRQAEAVFADEDRRPFEAYRFSPAVRAGRNLYISGVIGFDESGGVPADLRDELHIAFKAIGRLLTTAGGSFADIVSFDTFHVTDNLAADLHVFAEIRTTYMSSPDPSWTAVAVSALAVPSARIEIKVTAYLAASAG